MSTDLVPPDSLIVQNGIGVISPRIAEDFIAVGNGITGNMIAQGFMSASDTVLDVGCGLGRLARPLVDFLTGEYYGLDVVRSSIDWCVEAYAPYENFHFLFADVFSTTYNTDSQVPADQYTFPFDDESFDFVWSTSLFTHLLIDPVGHYLSEMSRVMKPGAHCWNTFLILDPVAESLADGLDGSTGWYLPHRVDGGRVRDLGNPEYQSALEESRVRACHEAGGLEVVDVRYGPWSGRTDEVRAGGQDVIIGRKAHRSQPA